MSCLINNINDVLPAIEGRKEFIHVKKDGYSYLDYVFVDNDSFDNPVRLECRGLIFDNQGELIRRPFQKFMNLGEKGIFACDLDWTRPHVVTDKMDGSMIAAFNLNDVCRFGTRAGITEHSIKAEKHLTSELERKLFDYCSSGYTPIFEWCSPINQIVLSYKEDTLTLLASRNIKTGEYVSRSELKELADYWNLPLVAEVKLPEDDFDLFYEQTGIEGVVIKFDDGYTIKVKTDEYVRAHRAVSFFERENMILPVVLNGEIDDLIPVLSKENAARLLDYHISVMTEVSNLAETLEIIVKSAKLMDRKTFAIEIAGQAQEALRSCYFSILDGKNPLDVVKQKVLSRPELLKTRWKEANNVDQA